MLRFVPQLMMDVNSATERTPVIVCLGVYRGQPCE